MSLRELLTGLGHIEWLFLLQAFVLLPYYYYTLSIETHKEYIELIKSAPANYEFPPALKEKIDNELHLFELDWWLILAIAALFTGLLSSSVIASQSKIFRPIDEYASCAANSEILTSQIALPKCSSNLSNASNKALQKDKNMVRTALTLYAIIVGLLIAFILSWGRVATVKKLRGHYFAFRPQKTAYKLHKSHSSLRRT